MLNIRPLINEDGPCLKPDTFHRLPGWTGTQDIHQKLNYSHHCLCKSETGSLFKDFLHVIMTNKNVPFMFIIQQ